MAERVVINYMVDAETKERIDSLAASTHRKQGEVMDWLVAEAWEKIQKVEQQKQTVEEAMAAGEALNERWIDE